MSITEKEELVVSIGGKTRLFTKEFVKEALKAHTIEKENQTFCAQYNREQENLLKSNGIAFDPVVEAVREDLLSRSGRGIQKYGVMLSRKDLNLKDWLQHLYEEQLDSVNYIKRAIIEIENNDKTT